MKDYKAEIIENAKQYTMLVIDDMSHWDKGDWFWTKETDEKKVWELLDKRWHKAFNVLILSLFREIAKEAVGEETTNEYWMKRLKVPSSDYSYGHMHGSNIKRSEILSNIEKVI